MLDEIADGDLGGIDGSDPFDYAADVLGERMAEHAAYMAREYGGGTLDLSNTYDLAGGDYADIFEGESAEVYSVGMAAVGVAPEDRAASMAASWPVTLTSWPASRAAGPGSTCPSAASRMRSAASHYGQYHDRARGHTTAIITWCSARATPAVHAVAAAPIAPPILRASRCSTGVSGRGSWP